MFARSKFVVLLGFVQQCHTKPSAQYSSSFRIIALMSHGPKLTAKFTVRCTPRLLEMLKREAKRQDRSVNWLANRFLEEKLKEKNQ